MFENSKSRHENIKRLSQIIKNCAIKEGDFKLSSGISSTFYFDIKRLCLMPEYFIDLGKILYFEIAENLQNNRFHVGGLESGAIPLSMLISAQSSQNVFPFYIRKENREHGIKNKIVGHISKDFPIVIIDDVLTSGNSLINSVYRLQAETTLRPSLAICVIDRGQNSEEKIYYKTGVKLFLFFKEGEFE